MILSIGIDVAKEKLDVFCDNASFVVGNTRSEIIKAFNRYDPSACGIVMESTGKYHRIAHKTLVGQGFKVMLVNPFQSRHFAKSMNVLCKTDKVDAKILSIYGERMDFRETAYFTESQEKLQEISRHLDDLKKMKQETENRHRESKGFIKKSLGKLIKRIDKEIKEAESLLEETVASDEHYKKQASLLCSIPGIGMTSAIMLLSYLRELGTVNKREIAALAGLAPVNNDSGKYQGKRIVKGGRREVRSHLYMPTMGAATRHNERLKVIYDRLVRANKPKKVALTACMRKLVIWANAILESGEPWRENYENS